MRLENALLIGGVVVGRYVVDYRHKKTSRKRLVLLGFFGRHERI